jgi:hypothetical protein
LQFFEEISKKYLQFQEWAKFCKKYVTPDRILGKVTQSYREISVLSIQISSAIPLDNTRNKKYNDIVLHSGLSRSIRDTTTWLQPDPDVRHTWRLSLPFPHLLMSAASMHTCKQAFV